MSDSFIPRPASPSASPSPPRSVQRARSTSSIRSFTILSLARSACSDLKPRAASSFSRTAPLQLGPQSLHPSSNSASLHPSSAPTSSSYIPQSRRMSLTRLCPLPLFPPDLALNLAALQPPPSTERPPPASPGFLFRKPSLR